ncbi:hypothetical protein C6495_08495 [Candidatus Poribacteria bacterium]|nr:MAG: hypothetical protein C6495_08495 [Candidatus Poribacteria bacterium]
MKTDDVLVFLGALLLFCVIAGGFTLWYHHQRKKLAEEDKAFQQRLKERHPAHTRAPSVTTEATDNTLSVERLSQPGDTRNVSPETTEHFDETVGTPHSDAEPSSAESTAPETPDADVPVSPYGFGPYPPLPEGWPADIWPRQSATHELMMRVEIKLAHQGIDVRGSVTDNGLIYPMIPGTVHVEWKEYFGPPGLVRYIAKIIGDPEACNRIEAIEEAKGDDFTEADIPADIKIIPFEEGGIDPYQFLNLHP